MEQGQSDIPERPERPTFLAFFFDADKPIGLRIGLAVVLLALATYPLWGGSSKTDTPSQQQALESSFPHGPAGLADSNATADQLRAAADDIRHASEEDSQPTEAQMALLAEASRDRVPPGNQETDSVPSKQESGDQDVASSAIRPGPFSLLKGNLTRPVAASESPQGDVWTAYRDGLALFRKADRNRGKIVLDKETYDREFNDDLPALGSVAFVPGGDVWAGFTNGQVMRYRRYEWKVISRPNEPIRSHIAAIIGFHNEVFLAGRGLFKWDRTFKRLLADPNFRNKKIDSFAVSKAGELFLGGRDGLWQYNKENHTWSQIWKIPRRDRSIYEILPDHENSLLLGTVNGLIRISYKGIVLERLLPGERINGLVSDSEGNVWVGTTENGLKLWDGRQWYAAGSAQGLGNSITSLHIDKNQGLWCGVDRTGMFTAPIRQAKEWLRKFKDRSIPQAKPEIFADPCQAAEKVLKDASLSHDVAVELIDGRKVVFFKGHQVCPKQKGYRRVDGTVVLLRDWNILRFLDEEREVIEVPQHIPADKTAVFLLDSRDRIWLGTSGSGIHFLENGQWQSFGAAQHLENNPVTAILEDMDGNIWIGTTPPYDEETKKYLYPNLHLFNKKGWFHFDPKNGLAHFGTYSLAGFRDGRILVGTNGGISVIDKDANVTTYSSEQGLVPHFTFSMAVDLDERIWIAHHFFGDGITVLDSKKVLHIDSSNGLFVDRISKIAHDRSGRVWLLASNGTVGVYPRSFLEEKATSSPVNGKKVVTKSMFKQ